MTLIGTPFPTGGSDGAGIALAVTPNGRFLYAASSGGSNNLSAFTIAHDGGLAPIGAPIPAGGEPDGIKVSPGGKFLAVGVIGVGIGMFRIGSDGALTPVPGSPFPAQGAARGASFVDINCRSDLLFAGHGAIAPTTASVFTIASDGTLSEITGSPITLSGSNSNVVVLSPDDRHLFVSNQVSNTITSLDVASGGSLVSVTGSPFSNSGGTVPAGMATNRAGTLLYVANFSNVVTGFRVGRNGELSPVAGSPFATGVTGLLRSLTAFPPKSCEDDAGDDDLNLVAKRSADN